MIKSFKLLMLLALGAGMFTLNSCSDESGGDDPTPSDPVCYMTSSVDGNNITTNFNYDSDNQVVNSIINGDTTIYEYSGGRLSTAFDGINEATFVYDAGNVPSRINRKADGLDAGYFILENINSNITKIEIHEADGEVSSVTTVDYDTDGNITSLLLQTWDSDIDDFVTTLQVSDLITDGKNNPYSTSFALIYSNITSPLIFGKSNIVSGQYALQGQNIPITGTHTYNSNNYALTSNLAEIFKNTYTFDCK